MDFLVLELSFPSLLSLSSLVLTRRSRFVKALGVVSFNRRKRKEGQTYHVHAKVMPNTILPALAVVLTLVRVFPEPLVDLLQGHGVPGGAQECLVDQLGIRFIFLLSIPIIGRAVLGVTTFVPLVHRLVVAGGIIIR